MQRHLRINIKTTIRILATMTCVSVLLVTLFETYFDRSFRSIIYALFLSYVIGVGVRSKDFKVKKTVLAGLIVNFLYAITYYLVGAGSYLMVPAITVCIAVPLLYSCMTMMDYGVIQVWSAFRKIQIAIYGSLIAELLIAIFGYQSALQAIFPPGRERPSLFGYFVLHNSFSTYFGLNFTGLVSLALSNQAFGQFCVMLTIFGFRYLKGPFNLSKMAVFVLLPIAMSIVSPNETSAVMLITIIAATIAIKAYLNIYSRIYVFGSVFAMIMFLYVVYTSDLGFLRQYELSIFYDIYVAPQLNYISSRSVMENLLGVDVQTFEVLRQQYEVALLSYMSATGSVFFMLNISVVVYFMGKNMKQIKYLHESGSCSNEYLEAQIMNVLFVVAMLVSTIHYPVIGTYIGSMVFIINLSLVFYAVYINKHLINALHTNRAHESARRAVPVRATMPVG